MMLRRPGRVALSTGVLTALLLAGMATPAAAGSSGPGPSLPAAAGACRSAPAPGGHYLGLVARDLPTRTKYLGRFANAVGVRPNLITYFRPFGQPFSVRDACMVARQGALPFIQIEPWAPYTVGSIANGHWDSYLRAYARAVRAYGARIALGFGHEMNGTWYPWAYGHVPAATFVAAWRRIHDIFAAAGATNVIWIWTINRAEHPPRQWWPGRKYVTWVGISGYFRHPFDRWGIIFNSTLASIAKFTNAPVLIAETAVGPWPDRPTMIRSLFAGLTGHPRLLGFTYFDLDKTENWRLEGHPRAVAAFRKFALAYVRRPL